MSRQPAADGYGGGSGGVGAFPSCMPSQECQPLTLTMAIARLAAIQHGVVALVQLVALGMAASTVRTWVANGRLHRIHRGVYAVGHPQIDARGRDMAAVLACGPGAVLSHRSAAALWGLRQTSRARIDVTAPRRSGSGNPGVDLHRAGTLQAADCTREDGIPCTTVARTLLDIAEVLAPRPLERAVERAETLRVFDLNAIDELLARSNGRRGAGRLRRAIAAYQPAGTREELEHLFLKLVTEAGLPAPLVNAPLGEIVHDFMWPEQKLIVETDGWATHGPRPARRRDLRRDRKLVAAKWRVIRVTWEDVTDDPGEVVRTLQMLLRAASPK